MTRSTDKRAFTGAAVEATAYASVRDSSMTRVTITASIGLALVLILSMGFAIFSSTETLAALGRVREARALSIVYADARFAVATAETLAWRRRSDRSASVARAQGVAAATVRTDLMKIARSTDRANGAVMVRLNARYARFFRGADQRPASSIHSVFADIDSRLAARMVVQRHRVSVGYDVLERGQRYVVRVAIGLSILGLACLVGYLFVISAYRRRLISSHEAEVQTMEAAVLVDSLTNIGNHRAFKDDLGRALADAGRHDMPVTLAMIDIDNFKLVNDQNGHLYGDRVLVELANVLRSGRSGDRAYRIGGDEFALILPHATSANSRLVLERIRAAAAKALHGSTVSIGYSTAMRFDVTPEMLQNQADAALYLVKRNGRDGISAFANTKDTWVHSTERVQSLRSLLACDTMPIAFQPIWDLDRAEILAFEALLRPAAAFGFAGPQDAFDLAERIGCAHELDRASRNAALQRARELPAQASLFINCSPQTLERDFDVDEFTASVTAVGLRPERVVVEITERSIGQIETIVAVAKALQQAGFGIALDDTGAGNAGLEIMSRLHFDYVKIDREIIVKAMIDRSAGGVVAAIVSFARFTGAYVIAEGIEDLAMLDFINRAGCAEAVVGRGIRGAQGYLLRRPSELLPGRSDVLDVTALLSEHIVHASSPSNDPRPRATDRAGGTGERED